MKAVLTSEVLLDRTGSTYYPQQLYHNSDPSLRSADNPTALAWLLLPHLQASLIDTKRVCKTYYLNTFPTGARPR